MLDDFETDWQPPVPGRHTWWAPTILGMLVVSGDMTHPATILGAIAILVATINIAGGFLVTQRMLKMFRK